MSERSFHNILVTGGCGFIGSNFLNYMVPKYPNVNFVNLDCITYCASIQNITVGERPNYKFVYGKLQDKNMLLNLLHAYKIDCVVHFAAQSHVDNSFKDSFVFTDDNIIATHVLLECCRQYNDTCNNCIKKFIYISTDEVYGDSTLGVPECKTELSKLCPTNPYAATKAAAEMIAMSYLYSHKLPVVITRSNNVYGPCQYQEKLIPKFILLLSNSQKCTVHGSGSYLRSFIHVYDVAVAIETILEKGIVGEIYNIGSDDEFTVNQIADILIQEIRDTIEHDKWKIFVEDRLFNDTRYHISSDKLKQLGWRQTVPFTTGLRSTISWYLKPNLGNVIFH